MPSKRQHLVSQSYLREWSDNGKTVQYIDKSSHISKLVGIRSVFVVSELLTVRNEGAPADRSLEVAFGGIEGRVMALVKKYAAGAESNDHTKAVKSLVALHFARSRSVHDAWDQMQDATVQSLVETADENDPTVKAFIAEYRRSPSVSELRDIFEQSASEYKRQNLIFASTVARFYNMALAWLNPIHLQRATIADLRGPLFIVADSPVVVMDGDKGSARNPVALSDADSLWFPLTPTIGVASTTEPRDAVDLDDDQARNLNQRVWDFAARYVVAQSSCDPNSCLPSNTPRIEVSP